MKGINTLIQNCNFSFILHGVLSRTAVYTRVGETQLLKTVKFIHS